MEEEVWKDLTLSSSYYSPLNPHRHAAGRLQDCRNPAGKDPPSFRIAGESPAPATSPIMNWGGGSDRGDQFPVESSTTCFLSSLNSPFEGLASPSGGSLLNSIPAKRSAGESERRDDRRHKRMMKNRESASRSRSRKMAYTYELERERSQLMEENAALRKQLQAQQINSAETEEEAPKKRSLSRSWSAEF